MGIEILLLAAGSSTRLGQSKQLLEYKGETLINHSIHVALESGANNLVVVLGSEYEMHQRHIKHLNLDIVYNPYWQKGIGSSIKAGLTFLINENNNKTEALIIMVCDQVYLESSHLKNIILKYKETKAKVIASRYKNTLGVPSLFDKSLFEEILTLKDDEGAKKIIQSNSNNLFFVELPNGHVDIDTWEDYKRAL